MRLYLRCALIVGFLSLLSFAQASNQNGTTNPKQPPASAPLPRSDSGQSPSLDTPPQSAPPESANESSSNDTRIDISPPKDDAKKHPDSEDVTSDVTEMHQWNPHKADKDVEVGEFYLKRKNLRAAESRFREALTFKPNDAVATFRLGEVLEQEDQTNEARTNYEAYLKILPEGKFAADAKKGIERIDQKAAK